MQPCDTDVVKQIDIVAHHPQRDDGFFCDGHIGSSGGNHHYGALANNPIVLTNHDCTSAFIEFRFRYDLFDPFKMSSGCSGDQDVVFVLVNGLNDVGHLIDGLAGAEHHFWKSLAERTMMIDIGKSEVFKRQTAKPLQGFIVAGKAPDLKSSRMRTI